ncbi:MAG: hypothetical protein MZV70_32360 [Desulfobacterales bacterium]|nr:hypothetical protein [Desulfobacterales bacterium]
MINTPAQIAADGIADAVIKKRILSRFIGMVLAEYIRQPPGLDVFIGFPDFWIKRNMPQNPLGIMNVNVLRCDIKITAQN